MRQALLTMDSAWLVLEGVACCFLLGDHFLSPLCPVSFENSTYSPAGDRM